MRTKLLEQMTDEELKLLKEALSQLKYKYTQQSKYSLAQELAVQKLSDIILRVDKVIVQNNQEQNTVKYYSDL